MPVSLLPKAIYPRLADLPLEALHRQGIRLLMLDFDNTIVPYTTDQPTAEMAAWIQAAKQSGLQLCVVSNSKKPRVQQVCRRMEIPWQTNAKKPMAQGIRRCMERFGQPPQACALCGDQIFTDVLGANAAGVYSILVSSIDNHNIWLKLRHLLELPVILIAKGRKAQ